MTDFADDLKQARTGSGTRLMDVDEALEFLAFLSSRGFVPNSMEAYEFEKDRERLDLSFSMLGLDKPDPADLEGKLTLARQRILAARKHDLTVKFQIWI